MALVRWRPTRNIFSIQDEINRLFEGLTSREPEVDALREGAWAPDADIAETESEIVVEAEVPGIDQENLKVSVQNNVLTFSGEKKQAKEEKGKNYHRVERTYGSFHRSFPLPADVDTSKTKASYKNGILTIRLPKVEKAKPKEIDIEAK